MVEYDYVKTRREDVRPFKESQIPAIRRVLRWVSKLQVAVYRKSGGRLMNKFIGGYPICVVTTTGAKSREPRAIPLIHLPHGDNKLLVAHAISAIESAKIRSNGQLAQFRAELAKKIAPGKIPVIGITGTGGAGKSSLIDELTKLPIDHCTTNGKNRNNSNKKTILMSITYCTVRSIQMVKWRTSSMMRSSLGMVTRIAGLYASA